MGDNESFTNLMGGDIDDFHERVNPHELKDEARKLYLNDLWGEFTDSSKNGVITLFDAKRIAEDLRIDGEESFLDNAVELEDRQSISYPTLVRLLDEMSRASTEEYRDMDMERDATIESVQYLGPIEYVAHLCRSREDEDGVQYKLRLTGFELTPKRVLLASSGALMLLICVAIILGLALMWNTAAKSQEETTLRNFQGSVMSLVVTLERELLAQHTLAMVDQGRIFGAWTEIIANTERQETHRTRSASAERKNEILDGLLNEDDTPEHQLVLNAMRYLEEAGASPATTVDEANALLPGNTVPCNVSNSSDGHARLPFVAPDVPVCASPNIGEPTVENDNVRQAFIALINDANAERESVWGSNRSVDTFLMNDILVMDYSGSVVTSNSGLCVNSQKENTCEDVRQFAQTNWTDSGILSTERRLYDNETHMLAMRVNHRANLAVVTVNQLEDFLETHRMRTVNVVDHLNFNFIRSTEIVVAKRNRTTQEIIHQATKFRFKPGCYFECERFPPSATNINAGFEKQDFGWSITPDYRPEPVVGAYAYIGSDLGIVLCLERDVLEIRGLSFEFITQIVNSVNELNPGTLELELVGFKDTPLMENFFAYEPCPSHLTDCVVDDRGTQPVNNSFGIIFRYDCKHCQRITEHNRDSMTLYTKPKKLSGEPCASSTTGCQVAMPNDYRDVIAQEQDRGLIRGNDYRNDEVMVSFGYLANYSVILTAKVDTNEVFGPVNDAISLTVGFGVLFLVTGMVLLVTLSHRAFDAIEYEWASYKRQIEREQARFASLVKGVIPPAVAERLMRGSKIIFDYNACASFVFVDICGFSSLARSMSAKQIARFATYCVAVMEEVCQNRDITKLRTIGDLFTCVAVREERHKADIKLHPVRRSMEFSAIVMHLFSPTFAHYPQNARVFRDIFKDCLQDNRQFIMPKLRIGAHCGPAVSGAFSIGQASHYDFFGISPSLANRMQQTASPGRIHTTMMVKELLRSRDPEHRFVFDAARKTVVRGQGTITSYFVKAVSQEVPDEVLQALAIQRARVRHELIGRKKTRSGGDDGASSQGSAKSYRSRRSSVSVGGM